MGFSEIKSARLGVTPTVAVVGFHSSLGSNRWSCLLFTISPVRVHSATSQVITTLGTTGH